jgi:hypothetical protein
MARRSTSPRRKQPARSRLAPLGNSLVVALRAALHALKEAELDYAVVGGLAIGARVRPRFTDDIDFVISTHGNAHAEEYVRTPVAWVFDSAALRA